jgi:hypothetical protein
MASTPICSAVAQVDSEDSRTLARHLEDDLGMLRTSSPLCLAVPSAEAVAVRSAAAALEAGQREGMTLKQWSP